MSIKISVILFILSGFKVSAPTWSDKFELTKGSYSASDIKGYCEYIIKKSETLPSSLQLSYSSSSCMPEIIHSICIFFFTLYSRY